MSKILRRCLSIALVVMLLASLTISDSISASADNKTGEGLAAHAMRAYNEGWVYSWGGASPGAVDCSGLIYSYVGGGERTTEAMLYASPESGYVSEGVPDIPGLGLWQSGHVGVYVGGGMAVDARDEYSNVCYQSVATKSWVMWFKVDGVSYGTDSSVTNDNQDKLEEDIQNGESSYLYEGSSGSDVEALQQRLKDLGYFEGDTTSYFGSETEAALKEFQSAAGLEASGVYDVETQNALMDSNAPAKTALSVENLDETVHDDSEESVNIPAVDSDVVSSDSVYENNADNTLNELNNQSSEKTDADNDSISDNNSIFSFGDNNDGVKNVQYILDKLGYYHGGSDGCYDEDTFNAVELFQVDNDINATGLVDESTLNAIFIAFADKYSQSNELPEDNKIEPSGIENNDSDTASVNENNVIVEQNTVEKITDEAVVSDNKFYTEENTAAKNDDAAYGNVVDNTEERSAVTSLNDSNTITETAENKTVSDSSVKSDNTAPVSNQTNKAEKDNDISSDVTPDTASGTIKSGGTNIAAVSNSDNTVKSPKTGDPILMSIESAKEYAAKYIDLRLAALVTILACVAVFFAGTVHYWNTSMEKRRQRARKVASTATYHKGSV